MSEGYELLESLGPAHPSQVSLTLAEAEGRERRGIPLAISGDPVPTDDALGREWRRNNPDQPSPFRPEDQARMEQDTLIHQHVQLRSQLLRKDWIPVGETAAAPVVETEAAAGVGELARRQDWRVSFQIRFGKVNASNDDHANGLDLLGQGHEELVIVFKEGHELSVVVERQIAGGADVDYQCPCVSPVSIYTSSSLEEQTLAAKKAIQDHPLVGADRLILSAELELIDCHVSHKSSPSVGAPNSALRDNSNPTEGDRNNQGRAS